MNHPLPKHAASAPLEFTFAPETLESEDPAPGHDENGAADLGYRSRQVSALIQAVTARPGPDDPYEQYRQRILHPQPEAREFAGNAQPPRPARADYSKSASRYQSYYSENYAALPELSDVEAVAYDDRPSVSRKIVLAGIAAILAGGTLGFAMANFERVSSSTGTALALMSSVMPTAQAAPEQAQALPAPAQKTATTTVISKKPIATASLEVSDVTGNVNAVIPLALVADAADVRPLSIKITGLPKTAFLSAGTRVSDTAWLLKSGEEKGVSLIVPASDTPILALSVAAIDAATGELAAPMRDMRVELSGSLPQASEKSGPEPAEVQALTTNALPETASAGAAAIPEPQSITPSQPAISAEASGLMLKGDMLLKSGDLVMARQFYMRAFEMGAHAGAFGVGRTYDPTVFKELNVQGLMPEPARALQWYEKARQAGVPQAEAAMAPLRTAALAAQ